MMGSLPLAFSQLSEHRSCGLGPAASAVALHATLGSQPRTLPAGSCTSHTALTTATLTAKLGSWRRSWARRQVRSGQRSPAQHMPCSSCCSRQANPWKQVCV
jgi:hypothetical protein